MSTSRTSRSAPKLSEIAKHVAAPKGVVSTGWPSVERKCLDMGITFRPWQPDVGRLILAKRSDGKYAATIGGTGMSIPRQVGKTFLVGAIVFALCMIHPKLTVIWTAHLLRTSEETFGKMQTMSKRKRIAPYVERVVLGSGEEEIRFRNGSRILFGSRKMGFGRGFDEVDVLIFDEAQILTESALDDMVPATNQSRQATSALLLFMGTPPKPTDPGEVFTRMRMEALTGEDDDTGWVEFGADEDFHPSPAPAPLSGRDWSQVSKANPSYPQDTPREAILRMRKKLGADSFLREGLGLWDEIDVHESALPGWSDLVLDEGDALSPDARPDALSLDMSHDRVAAVAACWSSESSRHVKVVAMDFAHTPDLVDLMVGMAGRRIPVVIDAISPAASLVAELEARKVKVIVTSDRHMARACGGVADDVKAGALTHEGQRQLDDAVAGAKKRKIGDAGGWGWDRKDPSVNIAPLVAVTLARYGAVTAKKRGKGPSRIVVRGWSR